MLIGIDYDLRLWLKLSCFGSVVCFVLVNKSWRHNFSWGGSSLKRMWARVREWNVIRNWQMAVFWTFQTCSQLAFSISCMYHYVSMPIHEYTNQLCILSWRTSLGLHSYRYISVFHSSNNQWVFGIFPSSGIGCLDKKNSPLSPHYLLSPVISCWFRQRKSRASEACQSICAGTRRGILWILDRCYIW